MTRSRRTALICGVLALAAAAAVAAMLHPPVERSWRSDQVVPDGMKRFSARVPVLTVTLPLPGADPVARDLTARISQHGQFAFTRPDRRTLQATPLDPSAGYAASQALKVAESVAGTRAVLGSRTIEAISLTAPAADSSASLALSTPTVRTELDKVLVGGYTVSTSSLSGQSVTLTYYGSGVTRKGLDHVAATLAQVLRCSADSIKISLAE